MSNAVVTNTFSASTTAVASQVNTNFTDLLNVLNGTSGTLGALSGGSIANDVMAVQRPVTSQPFFFPAGKTAATYVADATGVLWVAAAGAITTALPCFNILSTDYTVANRTTKMQVRVSLGAGTTAPTSTFTFGLYPITISNGAGTTYVISTGTVVAGSTVAFVAPTAATFATSASGTFTIPANGAYALGCITSVATTAAGSITLANASLFVSHA